MKRDPQIPCAAACPGIRWLPARGASGGGWQSAWRHLATLQARHVRGALLGLLMLGPLMVSAFAAPPPPPPHDTTATSASAALRMPAALSERVETDPQVQLVRSQLAAMEARGDQTRSRLWPSLGLNAVAGDSADREYGLEIARQTQNYDAVVRWNLFRGGADQREARAVDLELQGMGAELQRARLDVSERLVEAWIDAQRTAALAQASERQMRDVKQLARQVILHGSAGRLADSDVKQMRLELLQVETQHHQAQDEARSAWQRLEVLTGKPLAHLPAAELPPLRSADSAALHPMVEAARLRALAAQAREYGRLEAHAPRVDLEARRRLGDRTDPVASISPRRSTQVMITWEIPLGGENEAAQREVSHRAQAANWDVQRLQAQFAADLVMWTGREAAAAIAAASAPAQVELASDVYRAAQVQFEAGRRGMNQLLQARQAWHAAERMDIDARARVQQMRLKLWALSGQLLAAIGL